MVTPEDRTNAMVAGMFLGELIGEGIARRVYAYRPDPENFVVKVQTRDSYDGHDYQNIAEWELWNAASSTLRPWLAPCVNLSPGGGVLIQYRCEPCPRHLVPKKLPRVLGDVHLANFGIHRGHPVLLDYGRHFAMRYAANAKAMRKVNLDEDTKLTTRS